MSKNLIALALTGALAVTSAGVYTAASADAQNPTVRVAPAAAPADPFGSGAQIGWESLPEPDAVTIVTKDAQETVYAFGDVAAALRAAGIELADDQKVKPELTTELTDGMTITIVTISTRKVVKTVSVPFSKVEQKTNKLAKGTTKVSRAGKNGTKTVVVEQTLEDGKVVSERQLSSTSVAPVSQITLVGTKVVVGSGKPAAQTAAADEATPSVSSGGYDLRRYDMWMKIAFRESRCDWNIVNRSSGAGGGLQFMPGTWRAMGGTQYAPRANQATKEQQITIANKLYDRAGIRPWLRVPSGGGSCS